MKKPSTINTYSFLFSFLLVCLILSSTSIAAQGNLLVMPRRVVLDNAKRTQELNLANTGRDTARYEISVIQYRMNRDGNFEQITEPDTGQHFATKFFRFYPRSVVLAPNEAQVVKIQLTNSGQLSPGEYRSHLYFRSVPKQNPLGQTEKPQGSSDISVKLVAVFGLAIPVIIRNGEISMKAALSNLEIVNKQEANSMLKIDINRSGNVSVYGDIKVNYVSPNGTITQVGLVNGLSVYTPNTVRNFQLQLDSKPGVDYHKGKLAVVYTAESEGKQTLFASAELLLK
ncbi:molecular chaperone [Pedobacter petrophilus]|uniref:Molecular chaperone n=1 Tax=Pedobacter petrophilus TaxID=1908241 RepID=A0A7K0FTR8_9SPHI|nr:molecular chaperone [Pedobacter petrophilus]MRX74474.1 molecular chaperone [Pedobacter petrophilus]